MKNNRLAIIVPCYFEEDVLPSTIESLRKILGDLKSEGRISQDSFIFFVDDGSKDDTWKIITETAATNHEVKGIRLSRNFGHQHALLAGMHNIKDEVDIAVTIDADLQDNPVVIRDMVDKYHEGANIVYAVRNNRDTDSFFKRFTAHAFYNLMKFMKVQTIYNHADFRLIDRHILRSLYDFREVHLFLRGMFPLIGFEKAVVYYRRDKRLAGETKYPLGKMMAFAWDGISSFSTFPLRLIFYIGIIMFLISFVLVIWALIPFVQGKAIPGWASTVVPFFMFSGLQSVFLGIIGEYLGKIYGEIKARPRYIISERIN